MDASLGPSSPVVLRRLSYRSVRAPSLNDYVLLTDLIVPAERRNRAEGITGCLWTGERSFVHVIEGEEATVHSLMKRIVRDPRHTEVRVIFSCAGRTRLFDGWALKWVRGRECAKVEGLAYAASAVDPAAPPLVTWPEPWRWRLENHSSAQARGVLAVLARADPMFY